MPFSKYTTTGMKQRVTSTVKLSAMLERVIILFLVVRTLRGIEGTKLVTLIGMYKLQRENLQWNVLNVIYEIRRSFVSVCAEQYRELLDGLERAPDLSSGYLLDRYIWETYLVVFSSEYTTSV